MNRIRAISYSLGKRSSTNVSLDKEQIIRRQIGDSINVRTSEGLSKITFTDITEEYNEITGLVAYLVYGENESNEIALWKKISCLNIEVEYDITELLV